MGRNNSCQQQFLAAVLGKDGAKAIWRAAERADCLKGAIIPRTIQAWLGTIRTEYEGEIPGLGNSYIQFSKNEERYSGSVSIGDEVYVLDKAETPEMLAAIAVALDLTPVETKQTIRDRDVENLGKSLDILAKARVVTVELAKRKAKKESLEKVDEPPGPVAAPLAPISPEPALPGSSDDAKAPKAKVQKPKVARAPKPATAQTIKLTRSEASASCSVCGCGQFKGQAFSGCTCLKGLAKSATVVSWGPVVVLELGEDWDRDAVETLLESVGRR